jgi:type IV pilus assembly protein PilC
MKLAYKAVDQQGQTVTGTIESDNSMSASELLHQRGLFVAELSESVRPLTPTTGKRQKAWANRRSQRLRSVAVFTRQLCVLISSGTQLVEALSALERQVKAGPWRETITGLKEKVQQGSSLSEAVEDYPDYFDSIYHSLVAAGESSGCLADMLERLATLKQKQLRLQNAISGALVYPSLLICLALGMMSLLLLFIVPKFSGLFTTMDVALPASTQVMLTLSTIYRRFWWAIGLIGAGASVGAVRYFKTEQGREYWDRWVLMLPGIGPMIKSFATARIIRLFGVLLAGHVPVLKALQLVRHAAGNRQYTHLIIAAEELVSRGEPLSQAFANEKLINPSIYEAIRSGEQSGKIEELLLNIAEFLDDENDVLVRSLTSIIEPVILIGMGLLVGLMSISMFMPLFDLTAMTGGGG